MADYYPLIARAVHGLSDQSPESRQHVYDRAREALTDQLRSLDPPLAEEDITQQQKALEAAIERLEAEYAPVPEAYAPVPETAPGADEFDSEEVPVPDAEPEPVPGALDREHGPGTGELDSEEPPVPDAAPVVEKPGPEHAPLPDATPVPVSGEFEPPVMPPATEPPRPNFSGYRAAEAEDEAGDRVSAPVGPARPRIDSRAPVVEAPGRGRAILFGSIVAIVVGAIAVLAFLLRDRPQPVPELPPPVAEAPAPPTDEAGKFGERVGGPVMPAPTQQAQPAARPEVAVAQRAILYEENPSNPQEPVAHSGRVMWRLEAVSSGQGQPLENAVRGVVEIPDANMTLNLLLRRNLDPTLPASHTLELNFTTKDGEAGRVVRDANVLQFKNEQNARGTPMAGLAIPVRENMFLIGLSSLQSDIERNAEFLLHRNWMDLPIRLASGQRAILSFEKGRTGEQVMADAFRQWQ
jgi:hypothetical protein